MRTTGGNKATDKIALLEAVRSDPIGWHWMDLEKLVDAWGFETEELSDPKKVWKSSLWIHPTYPDLNVTIPRQDTVHSAVALHIIHVIDNLRKRPQPKK